MQLMGNSLQVIVEKNLKSDVQDIDKKKYLVPADLTVGQVCPFLVKLR